MLSSSELTYQLITTVDELQSMVGEWMQQDCIGLDTEFMRSDTFFAKPGLIQISDAKGIYLVDPLEVEDLSSLGLLLHEAKVAKVIHAMSEDVDLLYHCTGVLPQSVFDTQIAAALCGYGIGLGYQALANRVLGVELDKSETRSDWLQRPLTQKQLHYAAGDVRDLLAIYEHLRERLLTRHLCEAAFEECQSIIELSGAYWANPEGAYLKVRGGWDLSINKQMLLKQLVIWRDQLAIDLDQPRAWIFSDVQLIDVCQKMVKTMADLSTIKNVKPRQLKRYGKSLLKLVREYKPGDKKEFQEIDRPLKGEEVALYKALKADVNAIEKDHGFSTSILGSRKMLERLVLNVVRANEAQFTPEYLGWRRRFVAERFNHTIEIFLPK